MRAWVLVRLILWGHFVKLNISISLNDKLWRKTTTKLKKNRRFKKRRHKIEEEGSFSIKSCFIEKKWGAKFKNEKK